MKIGVVADTHVSSCSSQNLPKKLIEAFKHVDMVLVAGDIGSPCVLEKIKEACPQVKAVWGNMDNGSLRRTLPEKQIIKAGKHTIGLTHGCGHPNHLIEFVQECFKHDHVDVIVFGHSHFPVNEKRNGVLLFNPGSPTDHMLAPFNSYGLLEVNDEVTGKIVKL